MKGEGPVGPGRKNAGKNVETEEQQEEREKRFTNSGGDGWQRGEEAALSDQSPAASGRLLFKGSWLRSRHQTSGPLTQSFYSGPEPCLRCRLMHRAESAPC